MNIKINSVEYREYCDRYELQIDVDFTINGIIKSTITIHDIKRLDISEIINYIREELMRNG